MMEATSAKKICIWQSCASRSSEGLAYLPNGVWGEVGEGGGRRVEGEGEGEGEGGG
jgi:hypothetical protein